MGCLSTCRLKLVYTMGRNRVKQALKEGKTVIGTMITEVRTPEIMRMMAVAGFDFVFIDTEHSPYNLETVTDMMRVGKAAGLVCLVRVPDCEYHLIARTLDAGAQGVMVPRVENREQVEEIIQAAKYPPWGKRGFAARPMITDYRKMTTRELVTELNEDTLIVIQIERKKAIEDIDQLVSVKGVDVALIGPFDLSISLGVPGELDHPLMLEAIQRVVDTCEKHNVTSGVHLREMEHLLYWKERGMRMLTYSADMAFIMSAATEAVKELRKHISSTWS